MGLTSLLQSERWDSDAAPVDKTCWRYPIRFVSHRVFVAFQHGFALCPEAIQKHFVVDRYSGIDNSWKCSSEVARRGRHVCSIWLVHDCDPNFVWARTRAAGKLRFPSMGYRVRCGRSMLRSGYDGCYFALSND